MLALAMAVTSVPAAAAENTTATVMVLDEKATGDFYSEAAGDGIRIRKDGTFIAYKDWKNEKNKIMGVYAQEGSQWRFTSPGFTAGYQDGTWNGDVWVFGGDEYKRDFSHNVPTINLASKDIYIKGKEVHILGQRVSKLEDKAGLKTTTDWKNITLQPGKTMEMDVTYKKAAGKVSVINPYENQAPLGDCKVYAFYTEDTSGVFEMDSKGHTCGEDNWDILLDVDTYEYTNDKLVYHTFVLPPFDLSVTVNDPKGEQVIALTGESSLTLRFDGSVLKSFEYRTLSAEPQDLSDNVDTQVLETADDAAVTTMITVRNNILDKLKAAFSASNIQLLINEKTGEIVMDNNVLFAKDSYALTAEGKAYLDQFVGIYAGVLLSDEFREQVEQIRFEGHTDSSGDFGYNQVLSEKRAGAVLEYCLESAGTGLTEEQKTQLKEKAIAKGYSCSDLIYNESGQEDPDASRRVAIRFFVKVN